MVNSNKHIVQNVVFPVATATTVNIVLANAVSDPDGTVSDEIRVGATIKAIFCEYWILGDGQQPSAVEMHLEKTVAGTTGPIFANSQSLYVYPNKKNIFYQTQGIVGDANANPIPFIRQWIKIPKGKQRMGLGDLLIMSFANLTADGIEVCGLSIYKEYY